MEIESKLKGGCFYEMTVTFFSIEIMFPITNGDAPGYTCIIK